MCAICKQAITQYDLVTVEGITVCRAQRYCLIQVLRGAPPAQIATLYATALKTALRAEMGVLLIRSLQA